MNKQLYGYVLKSGLVNVSKGSFDEMFATWNGIEDESDGVSQKEVVEWGD